MPTQVFALALYGAVGDTELAVLNSMMGQPPGPSARVAAVSAPVPLLGRGWPAAFALLLVLASFRLLRWRRRVGSA